MEAINFLELFPFGFNGLVERATVKKHLSLMKSYDQIFRWAMWVNENLSSTELSTPNVT